MAHQAFIGLGANLSSPAGGPEETLRAALRELSAAGRLVACSSLYRTEPVGSRHQPPFVNAVAQVETDLDPEPLLDFLLALERRYGRDRSRDRSRDPGHAASKGPRTLDLDLLLMDGLRLRTSRLTVPHPALAERRFVLTPLAEIAPHLIIPGTESSAAQLLAALPRTGPNRPDAVRKLD